MAQGTKVAEKATMADGDRAGASFGDPGSSGRRGRGSAIAPASESGQGHEKVGGEGRAQRSGISAFPGLHSGFAQTLGDPVSPDGGGRLWRNANAPDQGTARRDHKSTVTVQVCPRPSDSALYLLSSCIPGVESSPLFEGVIPTQGICFREYTGPLQLDSLDANF